MSKVLFINNDDGRMAASVIANQILLPFSYTEDDFIELPNHYAFNTKGMPECRKKDTVYIVGLSLDSNMYKFIRYCVKERHAKVIFIDNHYNDNQNPLKKTKTVLQLLSNVFIYNEPMFAISLLVYLYSTMKENILSTPWTTETVGGRFIIVSTDESGDAVSYPIPDAIIHLENYYKDFFENKTKCMKFIYGLEKYKQENNIKTLSWNSEILETLLYDYAGIKSSKIIDKGASIYDGVNVLDKECFEKYAFEKMFFNHSFACLNTDHFNHYLKTLDTHFILTYIYDKDRYVYNLYANTSSRLPRYDLVEIAKMIPSVKDICQKHTNHVSFSLNYNITNIKSCTKRAMQLSQKLPHQAYSTFIPDDINSKDAEDYII